MGKFRVLDHMAAFWDDHYWIYHQVVTFDDHWLTGEKKLKIDGIIYYFGLSQFIATVFYGALDTHGIN